MKPIATLVIGGSKGIGLSIANHLRQRGDLVTVLSRNTGSWDGNHIALDLSNVDSIKSCLSKINETKLLPKYIIFSQKNRVNTDDFDLEFMIQIKSIKLILNNLLSKITNSSIVFIGSPASKFVVREQSENYHLSKASLEHLTRFYAVNFGKQNIRFNCILPSTILKEYNREYYNQNLEISNLLKEITPLGVIGEDLDVANMVDFFCSEKSKFITGQTIFVDGGISLEGQESLSRYINSLKKE